MGEQIQLDAEDGFQPGAWLATPEGTPGGACRARGLACSVGYYGGQVAQNVQLDPEVPVMLHFGEKDTHIPMDDVNKIKEAHPDVDVQVYDADHGFNCDHRASFDGAAAALARSRTLAFFAKHLRGV